MNDFGSQLAAIRERRGLKKAQAAKLAGLDFKHYCAIERGKVVQPTRYIIEKLEKALIFSVQIVVKDTLYEEE